MNLDDYAMYAGQAPVMNAAWAFADGYWIRSDMRSTWRATHPCMRRRWAHAWLGSLGYRRLVEGVSPGAVVEAFVEDRVDHDLWEHFARDQVKAASLVIDQETWGVEANPEVVACDMVLVRLVRMPPGGASFQDGVHASVSLLMQYDVGPGWRLLYALSEPTPTWLLAVAGYSGQPVDVLLGLISRDSRPGPSDPSEGFISPRGACAGAPRLTGAPQAFGVFACPGGEDTASFEENAAGCVVAAVVLRQRGDVSQVGLLVVADGPAPSLAAAPCRVCGTDGQAQSYDSKKGRARPGEGS
jgi:hypothetical protein